MKILVFCFCFCNSFLGVLGQVKFEREYRIKVDEVPKPAIDFMDIAFDSKRIKWYAEESQDGKTVEGKTRDNHLKYSIEFDTLGNPIDVEMKVPFNMLKENLKNAINNSLDSIYIKHKILKTQIQWKADPKTLVLLIKNQYKNDFDEHYEIVIKAKKKTIFKRYELLFDQNGKVIKELEIIQRNTDNIEF